MGDLEILSPIAQSLLQWDKACREESVDNFDLTLPMSGQENGDGTYMDHTFHTPSFGDEDFDIPPISLPPTTPGSDTNSSDVYGSTQPLSHQEQPVQQHQTSNNDQQQQQQQQQQHQQHHLMSPQMSPSPCSQSGLDRIGPVMTAVTTPTHSPPVMMTSYSATSPHPHHHQQQLQSQPQQFQQQYSHPSDMYMLHVAPGSMMPPQSMQFHVQQYAGYSMPQHQQLQQQHAHAQHQQQHHMHQQQQLLPPSPLLQLQLTRRGGSVGSSPSGSAHTSPGLLETSEDSDDSGHLSQLLCGGLKRPSPEPADRPPSVGKPAKKPKVQKKKKKRDPNEPQKPVSAYALFFRDTQAAIKGQNPNASFGEVSKIVASMWDGLELDHKNVYKKKTEAAKKEYLKALAAYRASLVSKAANDPPDSLYGSSAPNSMGGGGGLSPLQKKSPLLTSLMEGSPQSAMQQQNMANQQSMIMAQNQMPGHHPHMHLSPPSHQMLHQMLAPSQHPQQPRMMPMMQQQHHPMQQQMPLNNNNNNGVSYAQNMQQQQLSHQGAGMMPLQQQHNPCSRNGDSNPQQQQDWERADYCNSDCVVSHCRDVFTTWVAARPPQTSYASVK